MIASICFAVTIHFKIVSHENKKHCESGGYDCLTLRNIVCASIEQNHFNYKVGCGCNCCVDNFLALSYLYSIANMQISNEIGPRLEDPLDLFFKACLGQHTLVP